jgi:ABC-type branched-subunit amino acid transport system substrate-binding protein
MVFGGIYSSMRQAIKGPAVVQGKTLYICPEQYEGEECHPLIFCTGPVPAQQVESMIPWLMQKTGAKKFYCPSADYIWPHTMNRNRPKGRGGPGGRVAAAPDAGELGRDDRTGFGAFLASPPVLLPRSGWSPWERYSGFSS